jgi:hypothetical protein
MDASQFQMFKADDFKTVCVRASQLACLASLVCNTLGSRLIRATHHPGWGHTMHVIAQTTPLWYPSILVPTNSLALAMRAPPRSQAIGNVLGQAPTTVTITSVEDLPPQGFYDQPSFRVAYLVATSDPAAVVSGLTEAAFGESLATEFSAVDISYVSYSSECRAAGGPPAVWLAQAASSVLSPPLHPPTHSHVVHTCSSHICLWHPHLSAHAHT